MLHHSEDYHVMPHPSIACLSTQHCPTAQEKIPNSALPYITAVSSFTQKHKLQSHSCVWQTAGSPGRSVWVWIHHSCTCSTWQPLPCFCGGLTLSICCLCPPSCSLTALSLPLLNRMRRNSMRINAHGRWIQGGHFPVTLMGKIDLPRRKLI